MKNLIVLSSWLFIMAFLFACGNKNQNTEIGDSTKVDESQIVAIESSSENSLTITARFISASSLEGDADLIFQKKDGSKIIFYRNYFDTNEPELKYMLIGDDGFSANPDLVNKTFVIDKV